MFLILLTDKFLLYIMAQTSGNKTISQSLRTLRYLIFVNICTRKFDQFSFTNCIFKNFSVFTYKLVRIFSFLMHRLIEPGVIVLNQTVYTFVNTFKNRFHDNFDCFYSSWSSSSLQNSYLDEINHSCHAIVSE